MKATAKSSVFGYALTALGVLVGVAVCVVFFTFRVDPYRLYTNGPPGINQRVGDLFYHLRLHKPYAIERIQPKVLVAGSSRSASLAPRDGDLTGLNGYNASLPGASMREVRRIIEHAHAVSRLDRLVIGLDYYMFDSPTAGSEELLVEGRFLFSDMDLLDKLAHRFQRIEDYWVSLFSVDAVIDSLRTKTQTRDNRQVYREDGTWSINGDLVSPAWLYAELSRQIYTQMSGSDDVRDYSELRLLLDFVQKQNIRTQLLITPLNGLHLEVVVRANAWKKYIDWQRQLVEIVATYDSNISIYGLEINDELVLEKIDTPSPSFKDGVHLTRRSSAQVFECLMGECLMGSAPVLLLPENMNSYFGKMAILRNRYLEENPLYEKKLTRWISNQ